MFQIGIRVLPALIIAVVLCAKSVMENKKKIRNVYNFIHEKQYISKSRRKKEENRTEQGESVRKGIEFNYNTVIVKNGKWKQCETKTNQKRQDGKEKC